MTIRLQEVHTGEMWLYCRSTSGADRFIHIETSLALDFEPTTDRLEVWHFGNMIDNLDDYPIQLIDQFSWINKAYRLLVVGGNGIITDEQFNILANYVDLLNCIFSSKNEYFPTFNNQLLIKYPSLKTRLG